MKTREISIGPVTIGGSRFIVIAGPCCIESEEQFSKTAEVAKAAGAAMLRGGIYKLRTNPHSFQGLGNEGLAIARKVRKTLHMPIVSEVTDARQIASLIDAVDVLQVGTRSMYNYELLKELGETGKPILLKRGFSATIEEWLFAAEYVEKHGNPHVILCERGIRTFEKATRNTLDLSAVPLVKQKSELPCLVDPSHGTGIRELIEPMSLAAAACGADGLLIEIHLNADASLSDGHQSIGDRAFGNLMQKLEHLLPTVDRTLQGIS